MSVMDTLYFNLPRLYVDQDLAAHSAVVLAQEQVHYLKNVMRRGIGDKIRVFNGRDGEWLSTLSVLDKRRGQADVVELIKSQPQAEKRRHLVFSPLKKARMDILIEKIVELGVTDIHPVLMRRSDVRKVNEARLRAQILEAAEQCERFSIPALYPLMSLEQKLASWGRDVTLYACLERGGDACISLCDFPSDCGFVIGPAGGFDDGEAVRMASYDFVHPTSLGEVIYRAETAAMVCLIKAD